MSLALLVPLLSKLGIVLTVFEQGAGVAGAFVLAAGSLSVVGFGLGPAVHGRSGIRIALRTRTRRRRAA